MMAARRRHRRAQRRARVQAWMVRELRERSRGEAIARARARVKSGAASSKSPRKTPSPRKAVSPRRRQSPEAATSPKRGGRKGKSKKRECFLPWCPLSVIMARHRRDAPVQGVAVELLRNLSASDAHVGDTIMLMDDLVAAMDGFPEARFLQHAALCTVRY